MALRCLSCDIVLLPDEAVTGYCPTCEKKLDVGSGSSLPFSANGIACPHCNAETDSLKYYNMPIFLFLFVVWMSWSKDELACPSCMRGKIAGYCALNIVTANILWPFIILPWTIINLLRSFTRGHSNGVQDLLR